ncbi:MAG: hypothetical protein ACC661_07175, partial [Verrucomicrobiales bacterium]
MAVLAVFFLSATAGFSAGQDPEWKAGISRIVITPEKPVFMSGYASRDHPSVGVVNDLWVKTLVLEDRAGHEALLITSDLIGFRADVGDPICEAIMEKTGLARDQILLNSSHTHTGPSLSAESVIAGKMSEEDARGVFEYTRWLSARVVEAALAAYKSERVPVTLSYGIGVAPFVMNRREVTDTGVRLGVNPRGPADRSVPVLRIADAEGELVAVVYQAATHNTTLPGKFYQICGDYAGFSQEHIEHALPGVQAMFMLGCAGDANPYPGGTVEIAREHGATLGNEVIRVLEEKSLLPVRGELRTVYRKVDLPLRGLLSKKEIRELGMGKGGWRQYVAGQMMELHEKGEPALESYSAPFALWQFGNDLTLVALSGEVVVDYALR